MKAQEILITPDMAAKWLEDSDVNYRKINETFLKTLAQQIREGKWEFNGETIKINNRGEVLDGQHRLWACIVADKPIRSLVVFGVESVKEADRGRPRTLANELKHRGEINVSRLSTLLYRIGTHENVGIGSGVKHRTTVTDALDMLRRYPDTRDSVKFTSVIRVISLSNVFFFHWLFGRISAHERDSFFRDLYDSEGVAAGDPIHTLRRYMLQATQNKSRVMHPETEMALIAKTWNARRENRPLQSLRWVRYGSQAEEFPTILGDGVRLCRAKPRISLKLDERIAELKNARNDIIRTDEADVA